MMHTLVGNMRALLALTICAALLFSHAVSCDAETKMYQCGRSISNAPCAGLKARTISRYQPPVAYERMATKRNLPATTEAPSNEAPALTPDGTKSGDESREATIEDADLEGMLHQLKIEPPPAEAETAQPTP